MHVVQFIITSHLFMIKGISLYTKQNQLTDRKKLTEKDHE